MTVLAPSPMMMPARRTATLQASAEPFQPPSTLSPTRISLATQCPRAYSFRYLDRIRGQKFIANARGTVMHCVLQDLFDLPPQQRTEEAAVALIPAAWEKVVAEEPEYLDAQDCTEDGLAEMLASVETLLATYFTVEDPTVLLNTEQEVPFEVTREGVPLVGTIDRIDKHPISGRERISDYKSGKPPAEHAAADRLFQVKMYALARFAQTGQMPAVARLIFLGGDADIDLSLRIVEWEVTEAGLRVVAQRVGWAWEQVVAIHRSKNRQPRTQVLCTWCPFLALCPEGQQAAEEYLASKSAGNPDDVVMPQPAVAPAAAAAA